MPELLQGSLVLTAPYGTDELKVTIASTLTFDVIEKAESLGITSLSQASFSKMPMKRQMQIGLSIVYVMAEGWDLTSGGKPVPLTQQAFERLPIPTLMGLIKSPLFREAMQAFEESASELGKSRTGTVRGAHLRRSGKHAKGRKAR